MKTTLLRLVIALGLAVAAQADVYIYNTVNERMRYEVMLPNGDTMEGVIEEFDGYYPAQTTVPASQGKVTTFKVYSETGNSAVEVKAPYTRIYLIGKKDNALLFEPVSWSLDNGQTQQRAIMLYNATGSPQTFDLIDEKEMRKITLAPGEKKTVEAKNGFSGSNGFHHLKFADGHRVDNGVSAGDFAIIYLDKRSPGKVQVKTYGHLAAPNGIKP